MSNKLDDSAIASESEHDFGVQKKIGCAKKYGHRKIQILRILFVFFVQGGEGISIMITQTDNNFFSQKLK